MFKKIGTSTGMLIGALVGGLMAFNTIDPFASASFTMWCTILGGFLGGIMGNKSTLSEPFYDWDSDHYPSIGASITSGTFSGIFCGAISWVTIGLVASAIHNNF